MCSLIFRERERHERERERELEDEEEAYERRKLEKKLKEKEAGYQEVCILHDFMTNFLCQCRERRTLSVCVSW